MRWAWILPLAASLAACTGHGCSREKGTETPNHVIERPIRLYLIGGAAGALEPCGCVSNMLGGVDRVAGYLQATQGEALESHLAGAGPMFFMEPELKEKKAQQDQWKAQALADSFAALKLAAWLPGKNDWAAGEPFLADLVKRSGDSCLSLIGSADFRVVGKKGQEIAFLGMSAEKVGSAEIKSTLQALLAKPEVASARIRVVLTTLPRRDILRVVEELPELNAVVLGKAVDSGDSNDPGLGAELIGETLVLQPANHLTHVDVVDFFIGTSKTFADATGIERNSRREVISGQLKELDERIAGISADSKDREGLQKQQSLLKKELSELAKAPERDKSQSYFLYKRQAIETSIVPYQAVHDELQRYYLRVNDSNKLTYADVLPPAANGTDSAYVGGAVCANCHTDAAQFWRTTRHYSAYETLSFQSREYDLDCVSCHVTGYEKPGGSNVTHNETLRGVQCEQCHGPGSKHVANPALAGMIQRMPTGSVCAECHHEPHVNADWKFEAKLPLILGPGHGQPPLAKTQVP